MIIDSIFEFVNYALDKNLIDEFDVPYYTNQIMGLLNISHKDQDFKRVPTNRIIDDILDDLLKYAVENGIIENYNYAKDNFDTLLTDVFTPSPSSIVKEFYSLLKKSSVDATNYFYKLMSDVNYIRQNRIKKSISYDYESEFGKLLITINLSKPEKDPLKIANLQNVKSTKYPKCQLCYENIGYFGTPTHPARNNLRYIPLELNKEKFYMQYSPYAYFTEHCIVLKHEHENMKISEKTYYRIADFLDMFPHYFLGSNAGLPVVGGSILDHEHYQGGKFRFPLDDAESLYDTVIDGVKVSYLNWPLDSIKLRSASRQDIIDLAIRITKAWEAYENPSINLYAYTDGVPHNAVTPICRYENGEYVFILVLRNNLTTEDRPLGLYHPGPTLHHIKKENIGLIEVMGLAILPGRLKTELALIKDILDGKESEDRLSEVEIHRDWYNELKAKGNVDINAEVGEVFASVLKDCKVFKFGTIDDVIKFIESVK